MHWHESVLFFSFWICLCSDLSWSFCPLHLDCKIYNWYQSYVPFKSKSITVILSSTMGSKDVKIIVNMPFLEYLKLLFCILLVEFLWWLLELFLVQKFTVLTQVIFSWCRNTFFWGTMFLFFFYCQKCADCFLMESTLFVPAYFGGVTFFCFPLPKSPDEFELPRFLLFFLFGVFKTLFFKMF